MTSSLNCLLVKDCLSLVSVHFSLHILSPGSHYAFWAICFIFPLCQNKCKLLLPLGPVICNSLYLLRWKTGQNSDHWLSQDLWRRWAGYLSLYVRIKLARSPIHGRLLGRALLLYSQASSLSSGLDHDSFMKTQREMGLLRVLLGKSHFVFMMTFLSSAAEES